MKTLCLNHNLSYIYYLPLRIDELHDIFLPVYLLQSSITCDNQLATPIQLPFFFKHACHAKPGKDIKRAGSNS